MNNHITEGSIFEDLGFDAAEAENLKIRSTLMGSVNSYIETHGLTQAQAAKLMGVSQPRISNLKKGQIDKFTIDMLVNMLARAHVSVSLIVEDKFAA